MAPRGAGTRRGGPGLRDERARSVLPRETGGGGGDRGRGDDGGGGGGDGGDGRSDGDPDRRGANIALSVLLALPVVALASVVAGYVAFQAWTPDWRRPSAPGLWPLLWLETAIMLATSAALILSTGASLAPARGRRARIRAVRGLEVAMGLAVLFFCGLFAGWRLVHGSAAGFGAPGAGMFYALTGAHAVFAAGGVAFLAALLRQAHAAPLGPVAVAACRLYWHLVGVLWLCILGYFLFYGQA